MSLFATAWIWVSTTRRSWWAFFGRSCLRLCAPGDRSWSWWRWGQAKPPARFMSSRL
ncbi:unnamed protein product [Symbiodinium sp. CCMP2592]|nr:unnamed protein product [Symbiodinium sp. CCMP2592]